MLGEGALRSRAHALAITGVLALGLFAAIVLAAGVPGAPARATSARAAHPAIATNDAAARRATLPRQPQPDRLVQSAVRIRMAGANRHPEMTALEPLPGRVNYLIGNDPSK